MKKILLLLIFTMSLSAQSKVRWQDLTKAVKDSILLSEGTTITAASHFLSVIAFGASPDSTNEAATSDAIQAAIDTAYNQSIGYVYFPTGKYLMDTTIVGKPGVALIGDPAGSFIYYSDSTMGTANTAKGVCIAFKANDYADSSSNYVYVSGLNIVGNSTGRGGTFWNSALGHGGIFVEASDASSATRNWHTVTIRNCSITKVNKEAISIRDAKVANAFDNYIYNIDGEAFSVSRCGRINISGNVWDNVQFGIESYSNRQFGTNPDSVNSINISHNTGTNTYNYALKTSGGEQINVSNNNFQGVVDSTGLSSGSITASGITIDNADTNDIIFGDLTFYNNDVSYFRGAGYWYDGDTNDETIRSLKIIGGTLFNNGFNAILIDPINNSKQWIKRLEIKDVTINRWNRYYTASSVLRCAISISYVDSAVVKDNTVFGTGGGQVHPLNFLDSDYADVIDNDFRNAITPTAIIYFDSLSSLNYRVEGNRGLGHTSGEMFNYTENVWYNQWTMEVGRLGVELMPLNRDVEDGDTLSWASYNATNAIATDTVNNGTYSLQVTDTDGSNNNMRTYIDVFDPDSYEIENGDSVIASVWFNKNNVYDFGHYPTKVLRIWLYQGSNPNGFTALNFTSYGDSSDVADGWVFLQVSAVVTDATDTLRVEVGFASSTGAGASTSSYFLDDMSLREYRPSFNAVSAKGIEENVFGNYAEGGFKFSRTGDLITDATVAGGNLDFTVGGNTYSTGAAKDSFIVVKEADGTPLDTVKVLEFPNGSLTITGDTASIADVATDATKLLLTAFDDSVARALLTEHKATPWRVFFTQADSTLIELALGANGTVLKSNGAGSAPSFGTDATGGGGGTDYADSLAHDGRNVIGDSLITDAEGAARYQPLDATLTDIADGTIAENLVNTANPWADNEVADNITATSYLLLSATRDSVDNYAAPKDARYLVQVLNGNLSNEVLIVEGEGIDYSAGTFSGENASTTNKGIVSGNLNHFSFSSGHMSIADDAIDAAKLSISGVVAGTYENATVTVNSKGQVISIVTATKIKRNFWFAVKDTVIVGALPSQKMAENVTVEEVDVYCDAGTVTMKFEWRAEATPNNVGTDVMNANLTGTTTGAETTSFNDATGAQNSRLYGEIVSLTGSPTLVSATVRYTVD